MKIDKNIFRENLILFLVFLSLFTIGLSFYKDFGISIILKVFLLDQIFKSQLL